MLKAKHIIIVFVVNYCLMLFVSGIAELWFLSDKAQHIQTLMRTAGDMALEQTQATDDFFVNGGEYGDAYRLKFPASTGGGYVEKPMYEGIYGLRDTESIYKRIYSKASFQSVAGKFNNIKTPVRYGGATSWTEVPRLMEMGKNILPSKVTSGVSNDLAKAYGMDNYKKSTGGRTYYVTPLSLGVTYVDTEVLGALFMNNMDLLMRTKYAENGESLKSTSGGLGVLKGSLYTNTMLNNLGAYNPINDGKFTLLRGQKLSGCDASVEVYKGIREPKIEYKVIDMYSSSNDELLSTLFGSNTGGLGSKAAYLKRLDAYRIDPRTGSQPTTKPIVVAKVTFYADVIVPYTMPMVLDYRSDEGGRASNGGYLDIKRRGTSGVSGVAGSDLMTYTRYFAVTP